jgi:hypothetical protein
MEFLGNKRKYKAMIIYGSIIAFLAFFIGIITQGDDFQFLNLLLFTIGGGVAGGFVGVPLFLLMGPVKKIIITHEEIQLIEGKKPKVIKLGDIQALKRMKNGIAIRHRKGRIVISGMHGYNLESIYQQLNSKISA